MYLQNECMFNMYVYSNIPPEQEHIVTGQFGGTWLQFVSHQAFMLALPACAPKIIKKGGRSKHAPDHEFLQSRFEGTLVLDGQTIYTYRNHRVLKVS